MKKVLISLVIAGTVAIPLLYSCSVKSGPKPVLSFNFDNDLNKKHVKELLSDPRVEVEEGAGQNGSNGLRVSYVGFPHGSERVVKRFHLHHHYLEATLNYAVKFRDDFQFVISGKLHGLGPEHPVTGGGEMKPFAWSARINFHGSEIQSYVYHQNKTGQWGDSRYSDKFNFIPGRYHDLAIYVRVNDPPGASNGAVEIYADGELIINHDSLQLRSVGGENTLISQFLFETFHGGNTPNFAPRDSLGNFTTEIAWFDNIEVYEGKYIRRPSSAHRTAVHPDL